MSHQTHYRSYWGRFFTDQMTQPTVSSTEGQQLVSPPGKEVIPPGQALYNVK